MVTADEIKARIEQALPGATAEVVDTTGTSDHFRAEVAAPQFAGLSLLQQHRLVYAAVEQDLGGAIHALSIKTIAAP